MKLGSVFMVMLHSCLFHLTYSSNLNGGDTDHANGSGTPIDEETGGSKYCRYCGSEISTDSLLCPYCGRRQEEIQQPQTAIQTGKGFRGWVVKNLRTLRISLFFIYLANLFLWLFMSFAANDISICLLCFLPIFGILKKRTF